MEEYKLNVLQQKLLYMMSELTQYIGNMKFIIRDDCLEIQDKTIFITQHCIDFYAKDYHIPENTLKCFKAFLDDIFYEIKYLKYDDKILISSIITKEEIF